MNKKIILSFIFYSLSFMQTGFLTPKGANAFGLFLTVNKNVEHANYDLIENVSLSYITTFGLEFGASYFLEKNHWDKKGLNISYHFKGQENNLNLYLNYDSGRKEYYPQNAISQFGTTMPQEFYNRFTIGLYTPNGFFISSTHENTENEDLGNNNQLNKKKNDFLSIGQYFKVESFVIGISYSAMKEIKKEGYFGLTLGFII